MKIAIASDHGGFSLKQPLLDFLKKQKIEVCDYGPFSFQKVDYPCYASKVARAVSDGEVEAGILLCGTGLGMGIAANKFPRVRAVVLSDVYSARMSKEHNNSNLLALGGRVLDPQKAVRILQVWLESSFQGERHQNRLDLIKEIEKQNFK